MAFKSIFTSLIHSRADVPPIEKFHYLLSFLSDEAGSSSRMSSRKRIVCRHGTNYWAVMTTNERLWIAFFCSYLVCQRSQSQQSEYHVRSDVSSIPVFDHHKGGIAITWAEKGFYCGTNYRSWGSKCGNSYYNAEFQLVIQALMLSSITGQLPESRILNVNWDHIRGLQLADPTYYRSRNIDVLLGADAVPHIMLSGLIHGKSGEPMAQNTELGWILSGQLSSTLKSSTLVPCHTLSIHLRSEVNVEIERCWEPTQ